MSSWAHGQAEPSFAIHGYKVEGNSLLAADRISLAVMPFTGPRATFETIQQALEALEKAYLQAGYGAIRIELPEQDVSNGVIRFVVVEARLNKVEVQGARFHDDANIRNALPALRSGAVVNLDALQANLDLANENFSRHASVSFRQSDEGTRSDAIVRVIDDDPVKYVLSLDNTGNAATGRFRLGLSYLNANLFNRDHVLSVQALGSPTEFSKVAILGVGYRVPFYGLGDSADFTLGYSNVSSGTIDLFSVSGKGLILGARYNQGLPAAGDWRHKLSYSLDVRNYGNSVVPLAGGPSQIPDLRVRPLGITYAGSTQSAQRDLGASVTLSHNLAGGSKGNTAAFNQPGGRAGAKADFTTLKFSANLTERLSTDWSLAGALSGQYTRDLLISAEQFGAGGADSVRGFAEREVAGDRGLRASIEARGPELLNLRTAPGNTPSALRLQPVLFADAAWLRYNVAPGVITAQRIASIGLGLRGGYERRVAFKLDAGYVVDGADNAGGSIAATGRGTWRLHASGLWFF